MNLSSEISVDIVQKKFKLANVWQIRGHFKRALKGYQEVLSLQADYFPAYVQLGHLMLRQENLVAAVEYYDRALSINFNAVNLSSYYDYLGLSYYQSVYDRQNNQANIKISDNLKGKINLQHQKQFNHRSGWGFALNTLHPLHNSQGIKFDAFLENTFIYEQRYRGIRPHRIIAKMKSDGVFKYLATLEEKQIVPYEQPWVGFIHNPPYIPDWFKDEVYLQDMFEQAIWQKSIKHCSGLFCLSAYLAEWLKTKVDVPVVNLLHPIEIADLQFDFNQFMTNPSKKIFQVGWWLRKLNSIYQLPIAKDNQLGYEKIRLVPNFAPNADDYQQQIIDQDRQINNLEIIPEYDLNTVEMQHLANNEYDLLLSENIAFMDLYDAGANTAILDCMARATPLLVNPLPAVKEYLGEEYPFYFTNLSEAAAKAMDTDLIRETHLYLCQSEIRTKFTPTAFLENFKRSQIYQSI